MDQDSCIICFESFSTAAISALFCRHTFHHHCLMSWVENGANRCPICNHTFVKSAIIGPLFVAFEKYDPNMGAIAKKERLELEELVSQKEDMRLELLALDGLIKAKAAEVPGGVSVWKKKIEIWKAMTPENLPPILAALERRAITAENSRDKKSALMRRYKARAEDTYAKLKLMKQRMRELEEQTSDNVYHLSNRNPTVDEFSHIEIPSLPKRQRQRTLLLESETDEDESPSPGSSKPVYSRSHSNTSPDIQIESRSEVNLTKEHKVRHIFDSNSFKRMFPNNKEKQKEIANQSSHRRASDAALDKFPWDNEEEYCWMKLPQNVTVVDRNGRPLESSNSGKRSSAHQDPIVISSDDEEIIL